MDKIKVTPIIKESNVWSIEVDISKIQQIKDMYLNKIAYDDVDEIYVNEIKFIPTHIVENHYVVDLIDNRGAVKSFLEL